MGTARYRNTDRSQAAAGFSPALSARIFPWGQPHKVESGLVLPGSERRFDFVRTGSYFGLLPVTLTDTDSGQHRTVWVLALTGWYQWALLVMFIAFLPIKLLHPGKWFKRRSVSVERRSLDSISRKIKA